MSEISFSINKADKEDIEKHLFECSNSFIPPLESYVDISAYSEKIKKFAISFEAWSDSRLISLIACYLNDDINKRGFITNVSTIPTFQSKGIVSHLFQNLIDYAIDKEYVSISLQVNKMNTKAISFYLKKGFLIDLDDNANDIFNMNLILDHLL